MSARYLGIEIGGTKLQFGVGTGRSGELLTLIRRDVDRGAGAAGILRQIAEVAPGLVAEYAVAAVGIGFGGPVDAVAGRVTRSNQVAGWEDMPLVEWCTELLGVPSVLANDCDCAALAEARYGAGRGAATVLYVTVGTGIGGGLVVGDKLLGRGRPAVAEIGHLRPGTDAARPADTVEAVAAGPAIAQAVRRRLSPGSVPPAARQDLLRRCGHDPERLTAKLVAEAAADGNAIATAVLQHAIQTLGWAIAQALTLTAADVVVVGGGVSLIGEGGFFKPLRKAVAGYVFAPLRGSYRVVPAGLGEGVVVCGAVGIGSELGDDGLDVR